MDLAKKDPLWHQFLRRTSLILAVKTSLVTTLSYYAGFYFSYFFHFAFPQIAGLWCAISGILVLQVLREQSLPAAWLRIFGSFIGSFFSAIFGYLFGFSIFSLGLCVFAIVITVSLFRVKHTFRLACLTSAVIIVVGSIEPHVHPLTNAFSRFIESAIGSGIAVAITTLFYPLRKKLDLLQN